MGQGKDMSERESRIAQCRRGCSESQQCRQEATCFPLVPFNVHLGFMSLNGYVSLLVLKASGPSSLTYQSSVKYVFISCNL